MIDKKIKIVHIISNLGIGGAQVLVYDILNHLKKKNDITLSLITINSGEYRDKFESNGIKVIDLKEKGLFNPNIFFKLNEILRDIKPDIVHTHLNKADFYGRISAKKCNVPYIFSTCHNYSTNHYNADIRKKSISDVIDNIIIKYSKSKLIAISVVVKEYLMNRIKNYDKDIRVIYNGVDIKKSSYILSEERQISLRNMNDINKDDFLISVIGRLEKQKGHLFFLESILGFLNKYENIKVLIIGDGNLKSNIEKFVRINNLNKKVILRKFEINIEPYIEISDLICVPSLWEGFGLINLEGMIKRKIVLASNVGGIPEIITNGFNGFLFKSNCQVELLEKLKLIYENKVDLDIIKDNALRTVIEKFNISKNAELYYIYYKQTIDSKIN